MRARGTAVTRLGTAIGVAVAGLAVGAPAAHAAGWTELQALATCDPSGPPVTVQLDVDVDQAAETFVVACAATIDLNGHRLAIDHVDIVPPVALTIDDTSNLGEGRLEAVQQSSAGGDAAIGVPAGSALTVRRGHVVATAKALGAGIGGDNGGSVGAITVLGGRVTATGRAGTAGIGGSFADGGTVMIGGGVVEATGGTAAAGIGGGGFQGDGGSVTVTGGYVTATGGGNAAETGAGIGGGWAGDGGTVTIRGGTVIATGAFNSAGIGGGQVGDGATVTIEGGDITALTVDPTREAAGIGGGLGGRGGLVTISGGTISATGSSRGAGIGGGATGDGSRTVIAGGTVTATGSSGIGRGCGAIDTGPISVGEGAVVTAVAMPGCADALPITIGGPAPALVVGGTLRLEGDLVDVPAGSPGVLVEPTGLVTGPGYAPTTGSGFGGAGAIDNHGVIAFEPSLVQVPVNDHSFLHTFHPDTGSPTEVLVFAPTFASGFRTAPAPTTAGARWVVDDPADRRWWDPDDELTGPVALVEDTPAVQSLSVVAAGTATAGTAVTIDATAFDQYGTADPQPALVYTSTISTDTFSGNQLVATAPGTRTITVTDPVGGQTATVEITVVAGPAAALQIIPSATSVDQGGTVTFGVTATDAFGNAVDTSGVVLSSSVPTDQITGLTVHFPTASPHVITATLGTVTASVTIDVVPAAAPPPAPTTTTVGPTAPPELPATGGNATPFTVAAALAVAIGSLGVIASRRWLPNRPT